MEPRLTTVKMKKIAGICVTTTNAQEADPKCARLGELWGHFFEGGMMSAIPSQVPGSGIYGVYSHYTSDSKGEFDVTAGVEIQSVPPSPQPYNEIQIEAGEYLLFETQGELQQAVLETWQRIWDYFLPQNSAHLPFRRRYSTDFEFYQSDDQVDIYIGVKVRRKHKLRV